MGNNSLESYYQKVVAIIADVKSVLLLTAAFFTLTSMFPGHVNFSGTWKLNESKSTRGHSLCTWGLGDHMRADAMKIVAQAKFLTIYITGGPSPNGTRPATQERLVFDGKEREDTISYRIKKSSVKWSPDGQTMTVNSVVWGYGSSGQTEFKVTEVWRLVNNGKSISLHADIKSSYGEDTMNLIFNKAL
ncbi:MAG: hypothetical protein QM764_06080 [Chitinophagaceae bacterium]